MHDGESFRGKVTLIMSGGPGILKLIEGLGKYLSKIYVSGQIGDSLRGK